MAEYDAAEQGGGGCFVVHRGFPSALKMDQADDGTVDFHGGFATLRSARVCPVGGRGYFELEIISMPTHPQFGFATEEFAAIIRGISNDGVGDSSFSRAADGARKLKWH